MGHADEGHRADGLDDRAPVRHRLRQARAQQAALETDHRSLRPPETQRPAAQPVLVQRNSTQRIHPSRRIASRCSSEPDRKCVQHSQALSNRLKMTPFFVMAGLRPGHPRLSCLSEAKTWMPGTKPGHDEFRQKAHFIGCFLSRTLRMRYRTLMVRSASSRVSNHEASGEATMIRASPKTLQAFRIMDRRD